MSEETNILQKLIMQTMQDVTELNRQVSEMSTLLKDNIQLNNDSIQRLSERATRHRDELNILKNNVEDLKRSRDFLIKATTAISTVLTAVVSSAAYEWVKTVFFNR